MSTFEPFRAELRALRALAPGLLDDQRAARFEHAAASAEHALSRLEKARTTERLANRAPAARRVLERLAAEASAPDAPAWVERRPALLAHVERLVAACAEIETAQRAADERAANALRAAVAA